MLDQLVVGAETHGRLIELLQRCRHREGLRAHLGAGFGGSAHVGVRALFVGVSGTGKTLAARLLAAELGKDLYRVNLAAVVNKYIGETEKNLHHILSQAEALDVVLLLDEGDALLGTRTEIRSSNDRYANLETNFLLQRLEQYQGIAIVTTNAAHTIDSAFQRRMDVIARFDPPQAEERLRIWGLHLPADHQIDPIYVQHVSAQCVLTGAQIRNIVLHAALLAVDAGQPIRQGHLEAALRGEYQKAGAVFPMQAAKRNGAVMSHFLDAIGSEGRNGHG
jgi:SpoVK/Ycf46/Vps4 family AAA+-type ATPase